MDRELASWIRGQITAIAKLTTETERLLTLHKLDKAARELRKALYACNRAERELREVVEKDGK